MNLDPEPIARQLRRGEAGDREFEEIAFRGDLPAGLRRNDLAGDIAAFANTSSGVRLEERRESTSSEALRAPSEVAARGGEQR